MALSLHAGEAGIYAGHPYFDHPTASDVSLDKVEAGASPLPNCATKQSRGSRYRCVSTFDQIIQKAPRPVSQALNAEITLDHQLNASITLASPATTLFIGLLNIPSGGSDLALVYLRPCRGFLSPRAVDHVCGYCRLTFSALKSARHVALFIKQNSQQISHSHISLEWRSYSWRGGVLFLCSHINGLTRRCRVLLI